MNEERLLVLEKLRYSVNLDHSNILKGGFTDPPFFFGSKQNLLTFASLNFKSNSIPEYFTDLFFRLDCTHLE